jgi:hypothetical protein
MASSFKDLVARLERTRAVRSLKKKRASWCARAEESDAEKRVVRLYDRLRRAGLTEEEVDRHPAYLRAVQKMAISITHRQFVTGKLKG